MNLKVRIFDLAVVIDNKPRSAMLSYLAKIPKRIGFEKNNFKKYLFDIILYRYL